MHGVSQTAVQKWFADPRWVEAGFSTTGPWDAIEIAKQRAWRVDTLRRDPAAGAGADAQSDAELELDEGKKKLGQALRVWQLKKLVAQTEQINQDVAIKRGEYKKRVDAEQEQALKVRAIKETLMGVPRALRQVLADTTDPAVVDAILTETFRKICAEGLS